jgi:tetrapyrrole methylase family protein/MazG family protein
MVRFVYVPALPVDQWPEERLAALRAASVVYAASGSGRALDELGIDWEPLPDFMDSEQDAIVAIPATAEDLPLYRLREVVDRLLAPGGCPWDREQTHESLKRHLLEEAYEVLDAIDSGSAEKLREELGDLLMQPFMHAQMEKAAGIFDIDDVATTLADKLVRRHPHVFGEGTVADADEVLTNWDAIKQREKGGELESLLAGVPRGEAALLRAYEIGKRAARVGFEWPDVEAVFDKLHEEEAEFREAMASGDTAHTEAELGDLLFTVVNLARWAGVEPEEALRRMLNRFTERFMDMERNAQIPLRDLTPAQWDELWEKSKARGKS